MVLDSILNTIGDKVRNIPACKTGEGQMLTSPGNTMSGRCDTFLH